MKLTTIVIVLLLIQCTYCQRSSKSQRSASYLDNAANKTLALAIYLKNKARSLWPFKTTAETIEDKETKTKLKLNNYIETAQKTSGIIYDEIAPEINDYECSNSDPAITMNTAQLITLHGYYAESHVVLTEDGYMLTIHRIPYSRKSANREIPKKAILIHHGLLGSSADWVLAGPRTSLAFVLSDAGYDVWMANVRGNEYSRAHISRSPDSTEFWDFSFHEVSQYDLPAVIDYITDKTGGVKINYIGFFKGTTVLFSLLSTKTEYNDKLNAAFALAPVAYMTKIKSPLKVLSKFGNTIERFMKLVGANEFLPRNAAMRYLSKYSCNIAQFEETLCEISLFVMCGHDSDNFERAMMPIILGHVPSGASTKTLVHYAQEINSKGRFQQFDYGLEGNLNRYGSESPPEYPVRNITLPITLISAENDWLSNITDVRRLFKELSYPVDHYIVKDKSFNHLDFVFAKNAKSLVYDQLMVMLQNSKVLITKI